jgi:hypothetical protein
MLKRTSLTPCFTDILIMVFAVSVLLLQSCGIPEEEINIQDPSSKILPLLLQPSDINLDIKLYHNIVFQGSERPNTLATEIAYRIFTGQMSNKTPVYFAHTLECYSEYSDIRKLNATVDMAGINLQTFGDKSSSGCAFETAKKDKVLSCRVETQYKKMMSVFTFRLDSSTPDYKTVENIINMSLDKINKNISAASDKGNVCK